MVYSKEALKKKRSIWLSAGFLAGLALKIAVSFFAASDYLRELFTPFINWYVLNRFHNPWDFFSTLGLLRMFPYPPFMLWVMALPRVLFSPFLGGSWEAVTGLHLFVMRLPLLGFDALMFYLLLRLFPAQARKVLLIYWLSPLVFFINYVHGQLDIVPTALFFGAAVLILEHRLLPAAAVLALAAASKSHVMIAMPFVLVFLYRQKTGWTRLGLFIAVFAAVYAAIVAPYALTSQAFREMVFNSPEQKKLFAFAVPVSSSLSIVICPMVTVLIFFKFVSYKKLNREIFLMFLGLVFACLVIFVPPMPGWFLWSLPFLIYFYLSNRDYSRAPFVFYNIVYLFYFLFFFEKQPHFAFRSMDAKTVENLAMSVTMASVGFIALWMFRLGIERNEALKAKEAPLLIGIGGDSASGKHTTYHILRTLVGKDKSIPIFGDDFHKWERGNEMWNVYTHLNPSGNKLHEEMEAAVALRDGGTIQMGRYDHKSGTFSSAATVEASKFVFFVGLHPFYLKKMRDLIAIKIFMDTDESLRRYWKIRRDVKKRGYQKDKVLEQLESREQDSEKFIRPQAKFADLVIRMEPAGPIDAESGPRRAALRTRYIMDNSVPTDLLLAALSKIKTLSVATAHDMDTQEIEIAGTVTAREIMEAAFGLGLNFDELLVKTNRWLSGHYGVTQLIFLLLYQFKMKAR